jgi:DNA-binding CsgD family transcriptional regulator
MAHLDFPQRASEPVRLSKREIQVLSLESSGETSKEVAARLFVSRRTVEFHLANIYEKLGVNTRLQAFLCAARLGLICVD